MNTGDVLVKAFGKGLRVWAKQSAQDYLDRSTPAKWNTFRISSMGECSAKQTRDWIYPKKEVVDEASAVRMLMGELTHAAARHVLTAAGMTLESEERKVRGSFPVKYKGQKFSIHLTGHMDNSVRVEGKRTVLDYKKAGETAFDSMDASGLPDTYFDQAYGYMACSGYKQAVVLVIGTHGEIKAHFLPWKSETWIGILDRLAGIAWNRRKKRIGKREYTYGQYPCTYCQHEKDCWSMKAALNTDFQRIDQTSKLHPQMLEAISQHSLMKSAEKVAADCKSKVRDISLKVLKSSGAKKIVCDEGSLSWVSFVTKKLKVTADDETLIKKGYAVIDQVPVSYPKVTAK